MSLIRQSVLFGLLAACLAAIGAARAAEPALAPLPAECAQTSGDGSPATALPNLTRALNDRKRIVVLTMGSAVVSGARKGGDYYRLVERFLESTFKGLDVVLVQRGVSGELSRDSADRIRLEAARSSPDVVFWQVGTADALAGIDPDETKETVRTTIRWLKAHQIDVVLIGLHYTPSLSSDPQYQAMRKAVADVARSEGVLRIRRYEVGETLERLRRQPDEETLSTDIASLGNTCVAELLARSLATGLFARRQPGTLDKASGGVQ